MFWDAWPAVGNGDVCRAPCLSDANQQSAVILTSGECLQGVQKKIGDYLQDLGFIDKGACGFAKKRLNGDVMPADFIGVNLQGRFGDVDQIAFPTGGMVVVEFERLPCYAPEDRKLLLDSVHVFENLSPISGV